MFNRRQALAAFAAGPLGLAGASAQSAFPNRALHIALLPHIGAGRIRALAVSSPRRLAAPQAFARLIASEIPRWEKVVQSARIHVD